jgi:hypothetical protein
VRAGLDIAVINVIDLYYNFYKNNNEFFIISLYKIDRLIEERQNPRISIKKELTYIPETY